MPIINGGHHELDYRFGEHSCRKWTTSTYNLFEDQVTLAGRVYTDAMLTNHLTPILLTASGSKRVFAFAVIPIENFAASGTTNDYFYPNFIPTNLWSYGDVGLDVIVQASFKTESMHILRMKIMNGRLML